MSAATLTPESATVPASATTGVKRRDGSYREGKLHAVYPTDGACGPALYPGGPYRTVCGRTIQLHTVCVPGTFSYVSPIYRCAQCAARVEETAR